MTLTYICCQLDQSAWLTVEAGVGFFLGVTLLLVVILLIAKRYLVQSGPVEITINDDKRLRQLQVSPCCRPWQTTIFSCRRLVVAKAAAANAAYRSPKAVATRCRPKPYTLPARNSKTTGVRHASAKSRQIWISPFPHLY